MKKLLYFSLLVLTFSLLTLPISQAKFEEKTLDKIIIEDGEPVFFEITDDEMIVMDKYKKGVRENEFVSDCSTADLATIGIPASECLALKEFFVTTNGQNWDNNVNWGNPEVSASVWAGVSIEDGHVNGLLFNGNGLSGHITSSIGNLSFIQGISLSQNNLNGPLPGEIGNLSKLKMLSLDNNSLSGEIPSELGELTSLIGLELSHNNLSGSIPSTLGNLSNLIALKLSSNQLTGEIPLEIGDLSNLNYLDLSSNRFNGTFSQDILESLNLEYLILDYNNLTGSLPSDWLKVPKLRKISFLSNQLSGEIPAGLSSLSSLKELDLRNNSFEGELPSSLRESSYFNKFEFDFENLSKKEQRKIMRARFWRDIRGFFEDALFWGMLSLFLDWPHLLVLLFLFLSRNSKDIVLKKHMLGVWLSSLLVFFSSSVFHFAQESVRPTIYATSALIAMYYVYILALSVKKHSEFKNYKHYLLLALLLLSSAWTIALAVGMTSGNAFGLAV